MGRQRTTPWPVAVQAALRDARRDGYFAAMADVEAAIYSGDVGKVVRSVLHSKEPIEKLEIPLETRIALSHPRAGW